MGDFTRFIERAKKWKFTIINSLGSLEVPEPIGWDNIRLTLTRNTTFKTLFRGFSADVEYIFDGYDNIAAIDELEGIQAESELQVDKADTNTGKYTNVLTGKMDMQEYRESSENRKGVSVPLIDNLFNEKLANRQETNIPYDRPTDLDNNTIDPGIYKDITLLGREFGGKFKADIYLEPATEEDPINEYYLYASAADTESITLVSDFGENATLLPNVNNVSKLPLSVPSGILPGNCFYYTDLSSASITVNVNYDLTREGSQQTWLYFWVVTFNDAGEFLVNTELEKIEISPSEIGSFDYQLELTRKQGLLLWFGISSLATNDSTITVNEGTTIDIDYISRFEATPCKVVMPFEAFDQVATAITGEPNSFRSNFFGRTDIGYSEDGAGALLSLANGLMIRQFPLGYEQADGADRVAQLAFNFKELFDSYYKQYNIGIQVIKEDGKYIIIAEPQADLFSYDISHETQFIERGTFERVRDLTYYFSNVEAGYLTASDDLIGGLEEYNSKISHSTILSTVNQTLDLVSTYSGITTRIEKQRRKPFDTTATEELTGDKTIYFIELWRNESGDLVQRTDEGFSDIVGLDGLETYLNLGITPKQMMLRHGIELNVGLLKYPSSIVKYNTSDKTTDLQLLLEDESEYIVENGDITAGYLDDPLWSGYMINYTSSLGLTDYFNIESNPNALISYTNPIKKEVNYGWVMEIGTGAYDKNNNMQLREAYPQDVATQYGLGTDNDNEGIGTDIDNELIEVI